MVIATLIPWHMTANILWVNWADTQTYRLERKVTNKDILDVAIIWSILSAHTCGQLSATLITYTHNAPMSPVIQWRYVCMTIIHSVQSECKVTWWSVKCPNVTCVKFNFNRITFGTLVGAKLITCTCNGHGWRATQWWQICWSMIQSDGLECNLRWWSMKWWKVPTSRNNEHEQKQVNVSADCGWCMNKNGSDCG